MVINTAKPETSRRFNCAHELMHFYLHPAGQPYVCEPFRNRAHPYEYQANEGAAELLVPYRLFIPEIYTLGMTLAGGPLTEKLARRYGVSETVIRYRIHGLSFEISQYINGKTLRELRILSRDRYIREGGLWEEDADKCLKGILRKLSLLQRRVPAAKTPRFDWEDYEEELARSGFYEPYYRRYY